MALIVLAPPPIAISRIPGASWRCSVNDYALACWGARRNHRHKIGGNSTRSAAFFR